MKALGTAVRPKTQWSSATDEQINSYKFDLDSLLSAFSLPPDIAYCVLNNRGYACKHLEKFGCKKAKSSTGMGSRN